MNKKPIKKYCSDENPECHTCKSKIEDSTYRFLVVEDRIFHKHKMLTFHYFFPCWDVQYVCENLRDYEIFKAGFCCEKAVLNNPKAINNLRKNGALWDIEIST